MVQALLVLALYLKLTKIKTYQSCKRQRWVRVTEICWSIHPSLTRTERRPSFRKSFIRSMRRAVTRIVLCMCVSQTQIKANQTQAKLV